MHGVVHFSRVVQASVTLDLKSDGTGYLSTGGALGISLTNLEKHLELKDNTCVITDGEN